MKEELKDVVVGVVKSLTTQGGFKLSESLYNIITDKNNWQCIATKHAIINSSSMWCYEYIPPNNTDEYFLQIEIQTEFKTVTAINVITNKETKIETYT
jgi:hypothetical protein